MNKIPTMSGWLSGMEKTTLGVEKKHWIRKQSKSRLRRLRAMGVNTTEGNMDS